MHRDRRLLTALATLTTAAALPVLALPAAAAGPTFTRVSTDSAGDQLEGMSSGNDITPDGRYVLFTTYTEIPRTPSVGIRADAYVKDTVTGTTTPVGIATDGEPATDGSNGQTISDDGRYVAFTSRSADLVDDDTNGKDDVFRRDLVTGETVRISVGQNGAGNSGGGNVYASISGDGNLVAFDSDATDLVNGDTNGTRDIFVRNVSAGTTQRVSVSSSGEQSEPKLANPPQPWFATRDNLEPQISGDGSAVVFHSYATNLVPGDTNNSLDVFVHTLATGTTQRVSVTSDGSQADTGVRASGASSASISDDGRVVAFYSVFTDLVTPASHPNDVYVHDLETGTTELAVVTTDGEQGAKGARNGIISPSGEAVTFYSEDENLAPGDPGPGWFVRNLKSGDVYRIAKNADGEELELSVAGNALAGDDKTLLFTSAASNVVPGDTNDDGDAFVVKF
ncbi:TolB-like translocation protein [Kineosporia babensis]|uniref:WD40 repeat protein n=1 Tax=Kineosporia babensis TaxID=499548 RepID=A0A9X1SXA4_9ACTN|nr:hypothetical protein [Kineosporia babensis]MCD5314965.1 hypothetical protein [Kineosporia babensis]